MSFSRPGKSNFYLFIVGHGKLRENNSLVWCVKALANEDTLLRTHCCRHKCFPVCPRAQHLLRTQILCPGHKKMFLILFRNILCPQQMFPSLRSPRNIMGNNVSATMCPRLPGPLIAAHVKTRTK